MRPVTTDGSLILKTEAGWLKGPAAEALATKAELGEAERQREAFATEWPKYDGSMYYWPDRPNDLWDADDMASDLMLIFQLDRESAQIVLELARLDK